MSIAARRAIVAPLPLTTTFPVMTGSPVGPSVALSCAASVILHLLGSVIVPPEMLATEIADFRANTVHGVVCSAPAAPLAALAALTVSRPPGTAAPRTAAAAILRVRLVPLLLEVTIPLRVRSRAELWVRLWAIHNCCQSN